ncbi:hypothetical protein N0V88_006391 [Collariella sp. IMI 366227]|nr:hypothetical protein N0V88_006391 [Collariella sp. IMI 366227]
MDCIEHLRMIQADESSLDDDLGARLTATTVPVRRRSPVSVKTTTLNQPARGREVTGAKRKPAPMAEQAATEGLAEETSVATKAKVPSSQPGTVKNPLAMPGADVPQTNGTNGPNKKRKHDDKSATEEPEKVMAKKTRLADGRASKPAAPTPESSKDAPAPTKHDNVKASSAPPASSKPVHKMEYFERRAHEMLTDPLGFDDCVHDTKKQFPRNAARSFAQCRRRQRQPTPPLEMRGALGPAQNAKKAKVKVSGAGGLAKEPQKRAHQQKVDEQVRGLKGEGKGFGGGKHASMAKTDGANGKGKGKERAWLTASPQNGRVQKQGGKQRPSSLGKYSKST